MTTQLSLDLSHHCGAARPVQALTSSAKVVNSLQASASALPSGVLGESELPGTYQCAAHTRRQFRLTRPRAVHEKAPLFWESQYRPVFLCREPFNIVDRLALCVACRRPPISAALLAGAAVHWLQPQGSSRALAVWLSMHGPRLLRPAPRCRDGVGTLHEVTGNFAVDDIVGEVRRQFVMAGYTLPILFCSSGGLGQQRAGDDDDGYTLPDSPE